MRAVTLGAGVAALLLVGLIRLYGSMTRALVQQALTEARAVLASGARAIASRRSSRAWKTPADRFVREKRFKGLREASAAAVITSLSAQSNTNACWGQRSDSRDKVFGSM